MSRRQKSSIAVDIHAVTRDQAAEVLGISARRLHELVEADVLPRPVRRGVYDLPPMLSAYCVYRLKLPMPRTFIDGLRPLVRARSVLNEYMRRHPEECADIGTCADDVFTCRHDAANRCSRRR